MHVLFYLMLFIGSSLTPPAHTGKCGIMPTKAYSQNVLGRNVGYYVSIANNSQKTVDGLEWTANFYNNFDDFKGASKGSWQSDRKSTRLNSSHSSVSRMPSSA